MGSIMFYFYCFLFGYLLLCLAAIVGDRHLISSRLAYADAFDLMKRQRINLNLLFDHDPEPWLQNCAAFIDQIGGKGVANLNLFLSEVQ